MIVAEVVLWGVGLYLVIGLAVGVAFISRGVERVDAAVIGASWAFRLLILPGSAALWPLIVRRWLQARRGVSP